MALINGKEIKFYFGDIVPPATKPPEIEITGFTPQVQFDESPTTTSQTTGDGKAITLIRKKYSAKVDSILKDTGAEITGNTLAMTVNGAAVPLTKLNYQVTYDEHKITNASSPQGFHEFGTVRAERKGKADVYMEGTADLALSNTAAPVVITLASGHTITGNAKFKNKQPVGDVNEFSKNSYDFSFQGEPTEVAVGLVAGVKTDCLIEFVTDQKAISGKAIIFVKTVDSDVEKETKLSYDIVFTGTVVETP
ncbi:MAG: hypothetical protein AB1633_00175 [Elusimicrobiota bacterium]